MVNVGLRAYIWHQKPVEEQIAREVTCNIMLSRRLVAVIIKLCTKCKHDSAVLDSQPFNLSWIPRLRQVRVLARQKQPFEVHSSLIDFALPYSKCKEHGFPEQQVLQVQRRPSSAGGPSVAASEVILFPRLVSQDVSQWLSLLPLSLSLSEYRFQLVQYSVSSMASLTSQVPTAYSFAGMCRV